MLGVLITLKAEGLTFWPSEDKVKKWLSTIEQHLASGRMCSGEASKMSGRLQWGTQRAFKRLGRAMLRPIVRCSNNAFANLCVKPRHTRAQADQGKVFQNGRGVGRSLKMVARGFADGHQRGQALCGTEFEATPPFLRCTQHATKGCGGPLQVSANMLAPRHSVTHSLCRDRSWAYSDMEPPTAVMASFKMRRDNQICSLEILSIAFGSKGVCIPARRVATCVSFQA